MELGLELELNKESDEILDRRDPLDRGLVGDFMGANDGPSETLDDRSLNGLV